VYYANKIENKTQKLLRTLKAELKELLKYLQPSHSFTFVLS